MEIWIILLLGLILGTFALFSIFRVPQFQKKQAISAKDLETATKKWQEIEELVSLGKPSTLKSAVIEADKLLAFALGRMGYQGTLGQRLVLAKTRFSDYSGVWQAHKIRNQIVHDLEGDVLHFHAHDAINKFRKAFRDLGVLR